MFLVGVVVLYTVATRPTEPEVSGVVATTTSSVTTESAATPIEGVSPAVAKLLGSAGVVGGLTREEAIQLAPEVVRVLARYGVTLVVANGSESKG